MKKVFVLILFFLIFTTSSAVPRMIVGEMFTNTSSSPSYSADLTLNQISGDCINYLTVIRYHWWSPSAFDPFYVANASENNTRAQFYNNNYVPRFIVDGFIDGGLNHPTWRSLIDNRYGTDSPLRIVVTATFSVDAINGGATARIYNESTSPVTGQLLFVLTETGVDWTAPNGLTSHNQVMLDMIPDAAGEAVTIPAYDSIIRTRYFTIRDTTWLNPPTNTIIHLTQPESCQVVVFIQNLNTKEIYQGGKAWFAQTGIEENSYTGHLKKLTQVYPNPFSSYTVIRVPNSVSADKKSDLKIYDVTGKLVKTFSLAMANGSRLTSDGIIWDGKDETGFEVNPGIYFVETSNQRLKLLKLD